MHKLFVKPVSFEELAGRVEERKRPYSHKLAEILNSVPPSPGLGLPWWGGVAEEAALQAQTSATYAAPRQPGRLCILPSCLQSREEM